MGHRPRRAGPGRARKPSTRGGRVGARLLRRPRHARRRAEAGHAPAQGHVTGEARRAPAVVRSDEREGHADRGQLVTAHRWRRQSVGRLASGTRQVAGGHRRGEARRLGDCRRRFPDGRTADGAGLRDSAAARAQRPHVWRCRSLGNPRGVRGAAAVSHQGARGPGVRPSQGGRRREPRSVSARAREPERRQRRARASVRRDRRADPESGRQGNRRQAGGPALVSSASAPTAAKAA